MKKKIPLLLVLLGCAVMHGAQATSEWNTQDYDLYPGDFNGDGATDLLYVAKGPDKGSGIALSDRTQLVAGFQVWNANGFGIPWHSNIYIPVIGDYNWDGRSDIFMHRQTPGDHYLMLSHPDGSFTGSSQTVGNNTGGGTWVWSGDQHRVISVKAKIGAARGHRLFLQAVNKGGQNAIFQTSAANLVDGTTFGTAWPDVYRGFQWNLRQAVVHSGDFNNDGDGDLLIQAKPDILLIDYDVPIPVPRYRPLSFGVVFSPVATGTVQAWDRISAGVDWSASNSNLAIGDFTGDGRDDVIVQPKRATGSVSMIKAHDTQNQLLREAPVALTFSGAGAARGDTHRILAANVNGTLSERTFGVYLQATSSGGTDYIANTIPSAGGTVSTTVQSQTYQSSPTPGTGVGAVPGSFSVDPAGASTYRVAIEVPPGIAGLNPDLALTYSSRAGNGLVGVGWTVSGLSAVTRCSMTFEPDGLTDGVDLDANEAYCLDGARLKATSGANGAVGAEYRTEIESFQRVNSSGGVANDPGSWVVRDKAGLIRYYGNTADSRIELQGKSQAHVWAVNRIEDRYGNFIEYTYTETNALSGFEPVDVRWGRTGNIVGRVHFDYWSTRIDPTAGYLAGSTIGNTKLLKSIDVFSRTSATQTASDATRRVRTYFLNYESNPNTTLTHLKEVVQCDGGDGASRRCLGSTRFRWQQGTPGFAAATNTVTSSTTQNMRPTEINGDGRTDYLWTYGGGSGLWGYTLSSLNASGVSSGLPARGAGENAIVIDYNSDGYQDILQPNSGNYEWIAGGANGLTSANATSIAADAISYRNQGTAVGDFDGDGTQDLMYAQGENFGTLKLHLNQPGGFAARGSTLPQGGVNSVDLAMLKAPDHLDDEPALYTVNFDGDGRDDVLMRLSSCFQFPGSPLPICSGWEKWEVYSYDPQAQALALRWSYQPDASNPNLGRLKVLDANGDGLSDLMYATPAGWTLRVGTGSTQGFVSTWSAGTFSGTFRVLDPELRRYFTETMSVTLDADRLRYAQIVDYDRDGRTDVMFSEPTSNTWFVLRNSHSTTGFQAEGIDTQMTATNVDRAAIVDDRGDGLPDLIYPSGSTFQVRYGRGPSAASLVDRITDGLGAVTQVQYGPLTEQNSSGENTLYAGHTPFYEADGTETQPSFPYQHALAPVPVVAQIAQDNGLGGAGSNFVHTSYKYAGLKSHRRGRGLLGFAKLTVQNVNSKIVTENRSAQRWPYVGMVTFSEQRHRVTTTVDNSTADLSLVFTPDCETNYFCVAMRSMPPFDITIEWPLITTTNTLSNLSWASTGRWFPYTLKSVEAVRTIAQISKRTTTDYLDSGGGTGGNRYDDYGNPYYIRVTVDDGEGGDAHVTSTANTYTNDSSANWCLGRLTETNVTHSKTLGLSGNTGAQSIARRSTFTYRAAPYCDLDVETIEPSTSFTQWTDHDYDSYGNEVLTKVGGAGVPVTEERTATADFTATQGQFAGTIGNALGQQEQATWDPRFGVKATVTGPNGLVSTVTTDSFGAVTSSTPIQSVGVYTNTTLYWCAYVGCYDGRSVTVIFGTGSDGAQVRSEFDRLGRETRSGKLALDGRWLWTEKHYDPLGREYLASQPYFDANRKCWNFRRFDLLGRVTYQRDAYKTGDNSDGECGSAAPAHNATDANLPGGLNGGRIIQTEYDLLDGSLIGTRTTAHANDAIAIRVGLKWLDAFGRTRVAQDQMSAGACANSSSASATCLATFYDHDAQGNLTLVRQSGQIGAGATTSAVTLDTSVVFNARGFKTSMNDPDQGAWVYEYNAFGELTRQTDAKGQLTITDYDKLGRIRLRTEGTEGTTNWYYDETSIGGPKAIGKLTRVVGPGGAYEERYVYDDQGRPATTKRLIDGNWYRIDQTYDAQSRIELLKYPSWNTTTNPDAVPADADRVRVRHNYNAYGFLTSTQNEATSSTLWRVDSVDQYGVTQETLGNGVVTRRVFEATTGYLRSVTAGLSSPTDVQNQTFQMDRAGNVLKRADVSLSRSEDFTYDAIDRLMQTRLFNNAGWSGSPAATETMSYDVFGNIRSKGGSYTNYNYVVNTSGASLCNAAANPTAQPHAVRQLVAGSTTRTLCYDSNGNITKQLNGQYDTVTWWVSNLARRISKGSDYAEFTYAPDRGRYKQVAVKAAVTETTLYVGGLYERATKSGTTEHTYYLKGGSAAVAITKCVGACTTPTAVTKYLHRDHLGSVVALSNALGAVETADRMSFDAWGKRRADTWAATTPGTQISASTYTSFTKRGYTGHEHLDFLGAVHMNGRVYDSEIGRFLSADPMVQFPESSQGLNRYSYVGNNPLSYTDPSGFFLDGISFFAFLKILFWAANYIYMYYQLFLIAFGAPGVSPTGNSLEQTISVGFGTGRSGRWGQRTAEKRSGIAGVMEALTELLVPAQARVPKIAITASVADTNGKSEGVSQRSTGAMTNGAAANGMQDALKADRKVNSNKDLFRINNKIHDDAIAYREYLMSLSDKKLIQHFSAKGTADRRLLESLDHQEMFLLRTALETSLNLIIFQSGNGLMASGTEVIRDEIVKQAVTRGAGAAAKRGEEAFEKAWKTVKSAHKAGEKAQKTLDRNTREPGEIEYEGIACDVFTAKTCSVILHTQSQ